MDLLNGDRMQIIVSKDRQVMEAWNYRHAYKEASNREYLLDTLVIMHALKSLAQLILALFLYACCVSVH
jgi:hypothetical protein